MSYTFTEQSKSARSNILKKLKAQVSGADYTKLPEEKNFTYGEQTREQQVDNFINLLETNHAEVHQVTTDTLMTQVNESLTQRNIDAILYGVDATYSSLVESGIDKKTKRLIPFDFTVQDTQANKDNLFNNVPASITSSRWSIAQTGSIVLWPSPQEPRTMSLVPPVHFVIVDLNNLYPRFASLVEQQNWKEGMPTNALLISGPSKTADIQQTLAFGAHGPKELIVLLLNKP